MTPRPVLALTLGLATLAAAAPARAQHPGEAVYRSECASCHDGGEDRAPRLSILRAMSADDLRYALTAGRMARQGEALSGAERTSVIEYLAAPPVEHDAWIARIRCDAGRRAVDVSAPGGMRMLGIDLESTRMLSAEEAGLTTDDLRDLEVAWALAFPGVTGLRASPAVVGSTVFYSAVNTAKVLALDTETGCVKWVYDAAAPLRSGIAVAELDGRGTLYFGDARGQVHAVDAALGAPVWVANARVDERSGNITGAVTVHDGRVIVPLSASGVTAGANPDYECCEGRGAVSALDAATGDRLWEWVTMEEARYTGEVSASGARFRGPSGAPIWSTPTVDVERGRVYVTTGENTSLPATRTSDAIIALDLETGAQLWAFQATPRDVWHMGCGRGINCPDSGQSILRDWDFGGSAILASLPDGRDVLLAGQKSGHLWAVDPDDGQVIWAQRRGEGSALGGNHWGIAIDGERVFLTISDPLGGDPVPGIYAFDIASGAPVWEHRLTPDCDGGRAERVPGCQRLHGLSATPLVVDGAVVTGGLDGRVHVFDARTGEVLSTYDTARPFETINGVEGKGGSIDAHSIGAGSGMLFIGSGYGTFSQIPGNVLLALRPRG